MRRSVGWLAVVVFATGCTVAGPPPAGPTPPSERAPAPERPTPPDRIVAEPPLRVGLLVDVASARLEAAGALDVVDEAGAVRATVRPGEVWTVRRSTVGGAGAGIEATGSGQSVRATGPLVFRPAGEAVTIRVDDRSYRGAVLLLPAASGVTVVNVLDLEAYLLGVVPLEIGRGRPDAEVEAVKAQAIAARTYAIRHMGRRSAQGFDLYATVMDQAYGGAEAEDPVSTRAVRETRGEIIVYQGEPIEAFYHSTCGGHTAALEEVWPGEPRPYLRSISDQKPGGGWYCETSNRFRWTERWDHEALTAALSRGLRERGVTDGPVSRVTELSLTGTTTSGRARALRVRTNAGDHVVRGDSIRWVLRPEPNRILNSASITLQPHADPSDPARLTGLTVEGRGWGHGIGMCQVGALGRAREGHSYRDILSAYYPGTEIARLYR
jgi:stage II sporulation protein D